jgi:Arc/MetJ-type ribon-helix-helix transcriptional regulator
MTHGGRMTSRPATIKVRFDQQQRKLLDFLRTEGKFGSADSEIIRNVVLDYLKQQKKQGRK